MFLDSKLELEKLKRFHAKFFQVGDRKTQSWSNSAHIWLGCWLGGGLGGMAWFGTKIMSGDVGNFIENTFVKGVIGICEKHNNFGYKFRTLKMF